jgi:hypothetical protein
MAPCFASVGNLKRPETAERWIGGLPLSCAGYCTRSERLWNRQALYRYCIRLNTSAPELGTGANSVVCICPWGYMQTSVDPLTSSNVVELTLASFRGNLTEPRGNPMNIPSFFAFATSRQSCLRTTIRRRHNLGANPSSSQHCDLNRLNAKPEPSRMTTAWPSTASGSGLL